jgi:hypothetical protein
MRNVLLKKQENFFQKKVCKKNSHVDDVLQEAAFKTM